MREKFTRILDEADAVTLRAYAEGLLELLEGRGGGETEFFEEGAVGNGGSPGSGTGPVRAGEKSPAEGTGDRYRRLRGLFGETAAESLSTEAEDDPAMKAKGPAYEGDSRTADDRSPYDGGMPETPEAKPAEAGETVKLIRQTYGTPDIAGYGPESSAAGGYLPGGGESFEFERMREVSEFFRRDWRKYDRSLAD